MSSPVNPLTTTPPPSTTTQNSATDSSLQELGPNAFITLLTAQLQAQDPLDPMDPDQMVNELTSMNTLQETIQIRQDMDTLVSETQGAPASSSTATNSPTQAAAFSSSAATPSLSQSATPPATTATTATTALSSGLAALAKSLSTGSVANTYMQSNFH